ncbi:hypothetical protein R0K20_20330, partial [Staphylococcus sp. SIMBA_130]
MKKQNYKNRSLKLSICPIALAVLSAFFLPGYVIAADDDIEFNIDVLDVKERGEVDIDRFSRV